LSLRWNAAILGKDGCLSRPNSLWEHCRLMKHTACLFVVFWFWSATCSLALGAEPLPDRDVLRWERLPSLPCERGLAGAYAGVSNGALIVAGGTNFRGTDVWKDGKKAWYDDVYVLPDPQGSWKTGFKLAKPLAYGVSVTTDDGLICLGGGDAERHYAEVFKLRWTDGQIERTELPAMPSPMAYGCGAILGHTIYVAGGQDLAKPYSSAGSTEIVQPATMKTFWALDLSQKEPRWENLEPWPGESRMLAVAAVQDDAFYLLGGKMLRDTNVESDRLVFLNDAFCYQPKIRQWRRIADLPRFAAAAPTPAVPLGTSCFAVLSGDDGRNASRTNELRDRHPGFPADILCYHTLADTWTRQGTVPKDPEVGVFPPVTTATTWWHGRLVVPAGEIRPRVRTANVFWAEPLVEPRSRKARPVGAGD